MIEQINYTGSGTINGKKYDNVTDALNNDFKDVEYITIQLDIKQSKRPTMKQKQQIDANDKYRIKVREYMTKKSVPTFDFMRKFNDDIPMPMRTMQGTIIKETKGMYRMKLQGVLIEDAVNCSHCGRKLTHPTSKLYGIGPICGQYFDINTPETEEEFQEKKDIISEKIKNVTWEGWVIKKAIEEMVEVT